MLHGLQLRRVDQGARAHEAALHAAARLGGPDAHGAAVGAEGRGGGRGRFPGRGEGKRGHGGGGGGREEGEVERAEGVGEEEIGGERRRDEGGESGHGEGERVVEKKLLGLKAPDLYGAEN